VKSVEEQDEERQKKVRVGSNRHSFITEKKTLMVLEVNKQYPLVLLVTVLGDKSQALESKEYTLKQRSLTRGPPCCIMRLAAIFVNYVYTITFTK
jgi:hypothetical protein